jgi:hypothetical protein
MQNIDWCWSRITVARVGVIISSSNQKSSHFYESTIMIQNVVCPNSFDRYFTSTDSGQNYSDTSNIPCILHIKLLFFKASSWSQFLSDFDIFLSAKAALNEVLSYYFNIILCTYSFENMQVKHNTIISTFVDK